MTSPVFGIYSVEVKKVDKEKRDQCIERLVAKLNETSKPELDLLGDTLSAQPRSSAPKANQTGPIVFEEAQLL